MKPAVEAVRILRSWLETEAGYGYVRQLTDRYARGSLQDGSLAIFLSSRFTSDPRELCGELTHEFMIFLLQYFLPRLSRRPDQVGMILHGRVSRVLEYALRQFFWRLKDFARQKEANPRAYLHRRIREVLSSDDKMVVITDARNTLSYYPSDRADELCENPAVFPGLDDLVRIALPEPGESRECLFTARYLSMAALTFWQATARCLQGGYAVPIRELTRCLTAHHPWINRTSSDSLSDGPDPPGDTERAEEQFDRITALSSISFLAAQFTMGMDEQARIIFLWRLDDPPVLFREIASRLDLPDHNRPYRIQRKTIAAMKTFTSNWPGPPLNELPDEVGVAFIEAIRKICKKSVC